MVYSQSLSRMPPWNKLEMPQMNQFGLIHTLVGKEVFPEDDAEENLSEKYFFFSVVRS